MIKKNLVLLFILIAANGILVAQNPVKVAILGSTTATGVGATNNIGWAQMYENHVLSSNPASSVWNFAKEGWTTVEILPGSWDGSITSAMQDWMGTNLIIISLPTSDAFYDTPVETQMANYATVVALATAKNIPVYITTTQPRNFPEQSKRVNLMATRDAILATYGVRAIDFWSGLANDDGTIKPVYNSGDGNNLNDAAHLLLYNRVVAAINTETKITLSLNTPANNICKNQPVNFNVALDPGIQGLTLSLTYKLNQGPATPFTGNSFTYNSPSSAHIVTVTGVDTNNNVYSSNSVSVSLSNTCPKDAGQITAVILGSSTAEGVGASTGNSWVKQFEEYLKSIHPGSLIHNLAFSGYSTVNILPNGSVGADPERNITKALTFNPDVIIINLPSNDAASGYPVADQLARYSAILAAAGSVPVYITTTQPRNLDATGRQNLMEMRDATLANYPTKAINFWNGLATSDGLILQAFDSGDGIHLNNNGHSLIANRVLQANIIVPEIELSISNSIVCGGDILNLSATYPVGLGELSLKYYIDRTPGVSFTGTVFSYTSPFVKSRVYVTGTSANGDSYVSNIIYVNIDESCNVPSPGTVVILGSSTAAGWGAPSDYGWAQRYRDYLLTINPAMTVNNYAYPGYSTVSVMPTGTPGADPDRNITKALGDNPDVIIINLPSNDANAGYPVADQLARYNVILSAALAQNVPVYVTTTQPRALTDTGRQNLMAMRDSTFARYGNMAVDFWNGLATVDGFIESNYNYDGTHVNNNGHLLLFNRMVNAGIVNPKITISASSTTINAGDAVTFTATALNPAINTFQFYVNNVLKQSSSSSEFSYYSPLKDYNVYVIGRDSGNEPYLSRSVKVVINKPAAIWTGAQDQIWLNQLNWYEGTMPVNLPVVISRTALNMPVILNENVECNSLVINEGATLTVKNAGKLTISGDLINNGEIVLENQTGINGLASFINHGLISGAGNARVKVTLPKDQWFYLGSAISGATFGNFNTGEPGAFVHVYRNNQWYSTNNNHVNVPLLKAEGILVKYSPAGLTHTINYIGRLNTGFVDRIYSSAGWYLLGNPYPSFINWQNDAGWGRPNIDGTIWYRTLNSSLMRFVTYNRLAPEGARAAFYPGELVGLEAEVELANIPPMQSIWVKANAPTTLSLDNLTRNHGVINSQLKGRHNHNYGHVNILRITASNLHSKDGAVVYFRKKSIDGFDAGDSEKRFNDSNLIPEVYTLIEGTPAAINGLSHLHSKTRTLNLCVRNRVFDEVTLNFDLGGLNPAYSVYLEDTESGKWVNLVATPSYSYIPSVLGDVKNRFVVHFNNVPTSVIDLDLDNISTNEIIISGVGRNRAIVQVNRSLQGNGEINIEVYTIDGHLISKVKSAKIETEISLPNVNGLAVVKVITGGEVKSQILMTRKN